MLFFALLVDALSQEGNAGTCCSYCQELVDLKVAGSCFSTLFLRKGSRYKAMRQPSPLGLCVHVCAGRVV